MNISNQIILNKDNVDKWREHTPTYQNVIFVAHSFSNSQDNADSLADIICKLQARFPDHLFVSGVHAFGMLYDQVDYDVGEDMCLWLLERCDQMWVFGEDWYQSKGIKIELEYCAARGIPVCFGNPKNNIVISHRQYFDSEDAIIKNIWDGRTVSFKEALNG